MVSLLFKTIEGLAKRQIPNDIEGGPVKPSDHILWPCSSAFLQSLYKEVDILLNNRFLLSYCFFGKPMRQKTAISTVFSVARHAQYAVEAVWISAIDFRIFLELATTNFIHQDVLGSL